MERATRNILAICAAAFLLLLSLAAPALAQTYPGSGSIAVSERDQSISVFIDYDALGACIGEPLMAFVITRQGEPRVLFTGEVNDSETFLFEEDLIAGLEAADIRADDNLTITWSGECTDGGSENLTVTATATVPSAATAAVTAVEDSSSLPVTQLAILGGVVALAGGTALASRRFSSRR